MPKQPAELPDVTWAALLAKWTTLAKASAALPRTPSGERWRAAVPAVISLQAVTLALRDLSALSGDERALAQTKAGVLIRKDAGTLNGLWRGEPMPEEVDLLITDAREALRIAGESGVEWLVGSEALDAPEWGPVMDALGDPGALGLVMLPAPGETLLPGTPMIFVRGRFGGGPGAEAQARVSAALGGLAFAEASGPRQVYRQNNPETGGVARDVVAPMATVIVAGRPLLHEALVDGVARETPARAKSRRAQLATVGTWRVVVQNAPEEGR